VRRELRWALVAGGALALGALCATPYARFAAPYYAAVARLIALGHPWQIVSVEVVAGKSSHGAELQLRGEIRRHREDINAGATIVSHVQVGEAVETPVVFWTVLLLWPARSTRQRLVRIALAVPVFLSLEAATTAVQLIHSMAEASALLAGEREPVTLWERWTRFIEAGGRFTLELGAALLTVSLGAPGSLRNSKGCRQRLTDE
jgi:hypothetical protein